MQLLSPETNFTLWSNPAGAHLQPPDDNASEKEKHASKPTSTSTGKKLNYQDII